MHIHIAMSFHYYHLDVDHDNLGLWICMAQHNSFYPPDGRHRGIIIYVIIVIKRSTYPKAILQKLSASTEVLFWFVDHRAKKVEQCWVFFKVDCAWNQLGISNLLQFWFFSFIKPVFSVWIVSFSTFRIHNVGLPPPPPSESQERAGCIIQPSCRSLTVKEFSCGKHKLPTEYLLYVI